MIRAFSLALVFLTRLPVPVWFQPRPEDWGRSAVFFPLTGLVVGLLLLGFYLLFRTADPGLVAALLLVLWALASGGLHLDGLADTADAWMGGFGDRQKTLAIMKDPRSGPTAIVAIVLVLLLKFAALRVIVEHNAWEALLLTPVLGRTALLALLLTTPYVRPQGIGTAHVEHLPRSAGTLMVGAVGLVAVVFMGWHGVLLLVLLGLGFAGLRRLLLQRISGTTGDTLGAVCELTEAGALVILALTPP